MLEGVCWEGEGSGRRNARGCYGMTRPLVASDQKAAR